MKKRTSSAEHYFLLREANENNPAKVYGCSLWDMPDGHRLRREMQRKTLLQSPAEVRRWGKQWADISEKDIDQAVTHLSPANLPCPSRAKRQNPIYGLKRIFCEEYKAINGTYAEGSPEWLKQSDEIRGHSIWQDPLQICPPGTSVESFRQRVRKILKP